MGKYLEQAASPRVMNHAWRYLRKDPGVWVRGLPVADMHKDLVLHVGELAAQLRDGSYRPQRMRCFDIDKGNGKTRTICAAPVRDKLAQRAVLSVMEPLGEAMFHPASFGFRPSCTLDMALSKVREWVRDGYHWIGDADILGCFDSIPQRRALKSLRELCADRDLVALVKRWLQAMPGRLRNLLGSNGLPQGMVLSPFLCNLYLHQLDQALQRHDIPFVRFADDFVLLARDQSSAQAALKVADRELTRLGLTLHPEKSRVIRSSQRHRFLGKRLPEARTRFAP